MGPERCSRYMVSRLTFGVVERDEGSKKDRGYLQVRNLMPVAVCSAGRRAAVTYILLEGVRYCCKSMKMHGNSCIVDLMGNGEGDLPAINLCLSMIRFAGICS